MQTRKVSITGTGDSPWIRLDEWAGGQITFQCVVTGTVTYGVFTTNDDPNSPTYPVVTPTWDSTLSGVNNYSQTTSGIIPGNPTYIKVTIASGTGTVAMTVNQSLSAVF